MLLVFMILPFLVISLYLYVHLRSNMLQEEYDRQSQNLNMINRIVDLQLREYERALQSLYNNLDILSIIVKPRSQIKTLDYEQVTSVLRNMNSGIEYIDSAYIFGANGAVFYHDNYSGGMYAAEFKKHPEWEENIVNPTHSLTWIPSFYFGSKNIWLDPKPAFSCGMRLHDVVNTLNYCGICVINIDTGIFSHLFKDIRLEGDTIMIITDAQGQIVWSTYEKLTAEALPAAIFAPMVKNPSSFVELPFLGSDYIVTSKRSTRNDWYYISLTPRQQVLRSSQWATTFVFTQVAIMLFFMTIGALLIRRYVTSPLQRITIIMGMDKDEREKMLRRIPDDREDEIGSLYRSFRQLEQRLTILISDIQTANAKENEYRAKALQAQINPHFIYNTLDTINWMVKDAGAGHVCPLILSLSNILRYSISKKSDIVTLEEELVCLQYYLNIYTERYENMFHVETDIDNAILPFRTFRLLLQPLVENVMIHAFKDRTEGGLLRITGKVVNGNAQIAISDNGVGMSEDRVLTILSHDSKSIGLNNINQRLILMYGREYHLKVQSAEGIGTTIYINIPPEFGSEKARSRLGEA